MRCSHKINKIRLKTLSCNIAFCPRVQCFWNKRKNPLPFYEKYEKKCCYQLDEKKA